MPETVMVKEKSSLPWKVIAAVTMIGVIVVTILSVVVIGQNSDSSAKQSTVQAALDGVKATVAKQNDTIAELREQARQADCDRYANAKAFGQILHRIADNFATAPYPDPQRVDAVDGLNALGDQFDAAQPVPCPTKES